MRSCLRNQSGGRIQTSNVLGAVRAQLTITRKTLVWIPSNPRVAFCLKRYEAGFQRLWLLLDVCESIKREDSVKSLQSATHSRSASPTNDDTR